MEFVERYRAAVSQDPQAGLVFLGNFEVEDRWAIGERGLPRQLGGSRALANRMDEFALLLAGPGDHVLLKAAPDSDWVRHLEALGVVLPTVIVVGSADAQTSVTQDALVDEALPAVLAALAAGGAQLAPHGVSDLEEQLAVRGQIALAAPTAAVCKAVNGKVYSRRLGERVGLRQPPGVACSDVDELTAAVGWAGGLLADGLTVAVKDSYGVSGKGIAVVTPADGVRRLDRLAQLVTRGVGDGRLGVVVEQWVAKQTDLSCQLTLARDGSYTMDFVKEAIIERGVPQGHRIPARLSDDQLGDLTVAAAAIAKELAHEGYFGVVGIDAMTDPDGGLYPMVEINARHNMATYQATLQSRFVGPDQSALARAYPLTLREPLSFAELAGRLADVLYDPARRDGLLVNNFGTVNADVARLSGAGSFTGRLYGLVVADDAEGAAAIDRDVQARLDAWGWTA